MEKLEPETPASWLPLAGHILFVSIRKKDVDERELQTKIQLLGGKLETFFSREITCVLTDDFPVPTKKDKLLKRNLNGKLLDAKRSSVVDKAKSLGIDIMRFESFQSWLNVHVNLARKGHDVRNSSKPNNVTTLNGCFVKVENSSQNYCPVYKTFPETPDSDFERLYYENMKFEDELSSSNSGSITIRMVDDDSKTEITHSPDKSCSSVVSSQKGKKVARKPKRQYCECCNMYYSCLDKHLRGPSHMKFVNKDENFKQLTVLTNDMTNVSEFKDRTCSSLTNGSIKDNKSADFNFNKHIKGLMGSQLTNKPETNCSDLKRKNSTSLDSFNDLLKLGTNESSTFIKTELETILSPIEPATPIDLSTTNIFTEKSLLKEELNFSELFPSDILPDNDRLFSSSDISDDENIQQNVANIINNVFNDGVISENSVSLIQRDLKESDSSTVNLSGYSDCDSLSVGSDQSNGNSNDSETVFKNFCLESWSVKQISEVKMILVRCSVLSSVPYVTPRTSDDASCKSWKVKNKEDTKLVFSKSELGLTEVAS